MNNIRIIPRLDIKGPNLVKGIHLEGLRVLGSPEQFARYYYQHGADEIIYQDVVASLYERNSLQDIIQRTAREILVPLTVGGGLRTTDDILQVLRAGADKVCINTAALRNPELIKSAAKKFGSSTIVVAVEAICGTNGEYYAFTDNGREETGVEVVSWIQRAQELGAGEILLTSVDREGTGSGMDLKLIQKVSQILEIPLIVHGGVGSPEHVVEAIKEGAQAVSIASLLHYDALHQLNMENMHNSAEGNTSFRNSGKRFDLVTPYSLEQIKTQLKLNNIPHRPFELYENSHS